jgi:hypothetical protein
MKMENRDWKYWQKRMAEWNATGTQPTEDELAEMIQTDPPATSPEQKAFIQQHGTKKQKQDLALEDFMRVQRDFLKRAFLEERKKGKI